MESVEREAAALVGGLPEEVDLAIGFDPEDVNRRACQRLSRLFVDRVDANRAGRRRGGLRNRGNGEQQRDHLSGSRVTRSRSTGVSPPQA